MKRKVGELRQFSFVNHEMKVVEIIENPNINMWWTWKSEVCPHCKERIEKRTLHDFSSIEILIPSNNKDEKINIKDIILLGLAVDGKTMLITKDKFKEVLKKSENFRYLLEEI